MLYSVLDVSLTLYKAEQLSNGLICQTNFLSIELKIIEAYSL